MTSSVDCRGRVLLASASFGGTIAAARNLAANGFDVRVLSSERLGAAAWSRCVSRSHRAPPESDSRRFLDRLIAIGEAEPGQILLPTSDQTAWLYANSAERLAPHFRMGQPSISVIRRILDKNLLAEAAGEAGIAFLPSWDPEDAEELRALAPTLPYPVLIKPRTHVHRLRNNKGVVVDSPGELLEHYSLFVAREGGAEGPCASGGVRPFLQPFVQVGSEGVQSIAGFIDRTGGLFVTRRSVKVFQRTRPLGVGLCYESRPPAPLLSKTVYALCRELGYFGMFEVEFISFRGRATVIDFNPRFYNQLGLDIDRGMPLPLLACLDALGEETALRSAVEKAQAESDSQKALCDRFTFQATLLALTATSRISQEDLAYWRYWIRNAADAVDVAADKKDPMPGVIHSLSETYLGLRAMWRFLGSTPRASRARLRALIAERQ
ncbi:MAG: ATP-grasp domain-containing protein [Hyphomicrobiales bacterium]|nr:ATP-grasp domain-containing protein [Hyphomicrobiales bacterium]